MTTATAPFTYPILTETVYAAELVEAAAALWTLARSMPAGSVGRCAVLDAARPILDRAAAALERADAEPTATLPAHVHGDGWASVCCHGTLPSGRRWRWNGPGRAFALVA